MMRSARVLSSAAVLCAWFAAACGDTQGNVIERTAHSTDGGGGTGGSGTGGSGANCMTPGGCAETGVPPVGECSRNSDCTSSVKNMCNTSLHTCAECLVDGDCVDPQEACSVALNRCAAPCGSDNDCPPDDQHCDLAVGRAGTPGYCVGCRAVTDCTNPDRPFCVEGDCVACANGQC